MSSHLRKLYECNGFLSGLPLLNECEMAVIRSKLNEIERTKYNGKLPDQSANLHLEYEFIWNIAVHPLLIEYVQQIFDDEYAIVDSILFTKYPQTKSEKAKKYVAYHQDLTYRDINPKRIMAVWIALDAANKESGTMDFIPMSHKHGQLPHRKAVKKGNMLGENQKICEKYLNDLDISSNAVSNVLRPGQISFHDGYTVHGSPPNVSSKRRCGLNFIIIDLKTALGEWKYSSDKYMEDTRRPIIISGSKKLQNMTYFKKPSFSKAKL